MSSNFLPMASSVLIGKIPTSTTVPPRSLSLAEVIHYGFPRMGIDRDLRKWKMRNLPNLLRGLWRISTAKKLGIPHLYGQLCLSIIAPDGHRKDYGLVSLRVITTVGAAFVVDSFQGIQSLSSMRYHGVGGTSTVELASNTALGSEFGSAYSPANTRPTGSQAEGDSSVVYRTIGLISVTDTVTIAEHGLFSQASTVSGTPTGGILFDRSALASETIFTGFILQADYRLVVATGT